MDAEEHVRRAARLAALALDEAALRDHAASLQGVLQAFEALERAEARLRAERPELLQGIDPADPPSFGAPEAAPLRADAPTAPLPRREALAAAPRVRAGGFAVPRFVTK